MRLSLSLIHIDLVIRYRATENEKISSLWSDYLVYRLPKVKPDTILLNGGTEEEQIGAHTISRDMLEWKWKYEEGTCQIAVRDLAEMCIRDSPCIWVELSAMRMGPSFQTVRVR